eukprot:TRINITY_DN5514_c3_g1_i1.p1 TRINITY_DN5514_c3_g1~~TRINITY_DN5514_c3_g1_i1.p1  ORF type:complete len:109 (+),score=16.82 TRINITY_DN5514_c3_g1_i1:87-413(+)
MSVANEVERLYLPSHGKHLDAFLRDVGYVPIYCFCCEASMTKGFAVVVHSCKHTFHFECFKRSLTTTMENPQDGADAPVAGASRSASADGPPALRPLLCPHCHGPLVS